MQTQLTEEMRQNARALEADSILRACVHCGFCTATCPTYQLLGDELDGPRGRAIILMPGGPRLKQVPRQFCKPPAVAARLSKSTGRC